MSPGENASRFDGAKRLRSVGSFSHLHVLFCLATAASWLVLFAGALSTSWPHFRVADVTFDNASRVSDDDGRCHAVPQWTGARPGQVSELSAPVCYARGERMQLTVRFRGHGRLPVSWPIVEGCGDHGMTFRGTGSLDSCSLVATGLLSDTPWPDAVGVYRQFRVQWRVSVDGGRTFFDAGTSRHRIYVTLARPAIRPLRETLLDIGCRSAKGCSDAATVCDAIWGEFSRHTPEGLLPGVRREDGCVMRYWVDAGSDMQGRVLSDCHTLGALLASRQARGVMTGLGTCQAWSELFAGALRAQGITSPEIIAIVPPLLDGDRNLGFLMRTPGFLQTHRCEGEGDTVIHGQGTPDPPFAFVNHSLVNVDGRLYDPSYGNGPFLGTSVQDAIRAWAETTVGGLLAIHIDGARTNQYVRYLSPKARPWLMAQPPGIVTPPDRS
jgi:hypothetical protein